MRANSDRDGRLAALRRVRLVVGAASAVLFALFAFSSIQELVTSPETGFLGALAWPVFIVAALLLLATLLSIPFLAAPAEARERRPAR